MKRIPQIDLFAQYLSIKEDVDEAIKNVIKESFFIGGKYVEELEKKIAKYCQTRHAVSCASGTDALYLSLWGLGIGPGDEVITTPFTFFATAEVIAHLGATPVFVDIDPATFNINPNLIEARITKKTKAIIPVHLFGLAADMDPIMKIAQTYKLFVIEDACQAIGATYKNRKVGSIGDTGCFSFYPTKNLGAYGDGGIITTNNKDLADKIRIIKNHGSRIKYFNDEIGISSRLDSIQAAILSVKFLHLEEWNRKRIKIVKKYNNLLSDISWIKLPKYDETKYKHVFNQYTIRVTDGKRDLAQRFLKERGIASMIYYPIPLHLLQALSYLGYKKDDFKEAELACEEVLSLPLYPEMDERKIITISNILHRLKNF